MVAVNCLAEEDRGQPDADDRHEVERHAGAHGADLAHQPLIGEEGKHRGHDRQRGDGGPAAGRRRQEAVGRPLEQPGQGEHQSTAHGDRREEHAAGERSQARIVQQDRVDRPGDRRGEDGDVARVEAERQEAGDVAMRDDDGDAEGGERNAGELQHREGPAAEDHLEEHDEGRRGGVDERCHWWPWCGAGRHRRRRRRSPCRARPAPGAAAPDAGGRGRSGAANRRRRSA